MEEENKNMGAEQPVVETTAVEETPADTVPVEQPTEPAPVVGTPSPTPEAPKKKSKLPIIIFLVLLLAFAGVAVWYFVLGGNGEKKEQNEPEQEEKKEETEEKEEKEEKEDTNVKLTEDQVEELMNKYKHDYGCSALNQLEPYIDKNGEIMNLTEMKKVDDRLANVVVANYFYSKESFTEKELLEKVNSMFSFSDDVTLPNYLYFRKEGTCGQFKKADSDDDNYYSKIDNRCHATCSYFMGSPKTKLHSYKEDSKSLLVDYKVLYTDISGSGSDEKIEIYSDGEKKNKLVELRQISEDPKILKFEDLDEKYFEEGTTVRFTFIKNNNEYKLQSVEKI